MFDWLMKKSLTKAEGNRRFWVWQGPALKDLKELGKTLRTMKDEQFRHHVNSEKNDFAKWVGEVLQDPDCARALAKVKTKTKTLEKVEDALKNYSY